MLSSLAELDDLIAQLDHDAPFPSAATGPRGRQGSPGKVTLPHGWLDDPDDDCGPRSRGHAHRRLDPAQRTSLTRYAPD